MSINDDLLDAVYEKNYQKAVKCIKNGADVNYENGGMSPLCLAINKHDLQMVKLLLEPEQIPPKDLKGFLHVAMAVKDKPITKELLKYMNDFSPSLFEVHDSYHKQAIDNAWPDILELMIKKGARFKKNGSDDVNPMHYAAKNKNPIYAKILRKVVQPDFYYGEELTPLMVAAEYGNVDTMEALLQMGANPEAEQEPRVTINFLIPSLLRVALVKSCINHIDSVVHKATSSRNTKAIDILLKYKPDLNLNKIGTKGKTPLVIASENADIEMVKHLLKLGVSTSISAGIKYPLHAAVDGNSIEVVKLLLEYGSKPVCYDEHSRTPLEKAVHESRKYGIQNPELIDLLKYAQNNPQKVASQNPVYYPGRDPRRGRGPRS